MTVQWPSSKWTPMSWQFRVQPVSVQSRSPYTGAQKAIRLAQLWVINATWNNRDKADAIAFQAFLESLDGPSTLIRMYDWWKRIPQLMSGSASEPWSDDTLFTDDTGWGSMALAPTFKYDYPRGTQQVVISNLPVSAAALLAGDNFEVPNHVLEQAGFLHTLTRPANADAAGESSIYFKPGLRAAVVAGDPLVLFEPRGTFRMNSDPEAINRMFHWGEPFSLNFTEDLP